MTNDTFDEYKKAYADFKAVEKKMLARAIEVQKIIAKCLGYVGEIRYGVEIGDTPFSMILEDESLDCCISIGMWCDIPNRFMINRRNYANGMQVSLLTMTDEEVRQEINKQIKEANEKAAIAAAKSLTPEQKAYLKTIL